MSNRVLSASIFIAFLILIGFRIIPILSPLSRSWGFNHHIFLNVTEQVVFWLLAILSLLLLFLKISERLGSRVARTFNHWFFESKHKYSNRFIFIGISLLLFVAFPMKTHFLGDGLANLSNLERDVGPLLKWSEKGAFFLLGAVQSILGEQSRMTALYSYRIVSWTAGILSTWYFFQLAGIITCDSSKRALTFFSLLLSGSLLFFFGYVENYPALWIGFPAYVYYGLRFCQTGSGIWYSLIFLCYTIFIHLQAAILIPSFIFLVFNHSGFRSSFVNHKKTYLVLFSLIAATLLLIFIHLYRTDIFIRGICVPLIDGFPAWPDYTLFSFSHLIDVVNEIILLNPSIVILSVLAAKYRVNIASKKFLLFLVFLSLGSFVFLFVVDPKLGMPRDWDLYSLSTLGAVLLLISLIKDEAEIITRILPSAVLFMAVFCLPFIVVNLRVNSSESYVKYTIDLDPDKSLLAIGLLGNYYQERGNSKSAESLRVIIESRYPDRVKTRQALIALEEGDLQRALAITSYITPDEYSSDYMMLQAVICYRKGNYAQALKNIDIAIQNNRYSSDLHIIQSRLFQKLKNNSSALHALRLAHIINPKNVIVLAEIANLFRLTNQYDSVLQYSRTILYIDSLCPDGLYYVSAAFAEKGMNDSAFFYKQLHTEHGISHPLYGRRERELSDLIRQK